MKGLIYKDILVVRKYYAKNILFLCAFFGVMAILDNQIMGMMMGPFISLVLASMTISTMAVDDSCHWERMARSAPLSRGTIVVSKYLLGLMFIGCGIVVSTVISGAIALAGKGMSARELLYAAFYTLGFGALFLNVMLPLTYRFGVERARYFFLAMAFLPVLLSYAASSMQLAMPTGENLEIILGFLPVVFLLLLPVSCLLSLYIYQKKEAL